MYKKLFLVSVLFCLFFIGNNVFAEDALKVLENEGFKPGVYKDDGKTIDGKTPVGSNELNNGLTETKDESQDITSEKFTINTDTFSVGGKQLKDSGDGTSKGLINSVLGEIIKNLMIALGIISLFIMTIGAGYMILFHGQDEYLSKGKNIFIAGITSLVIALSSYYLVNLVGYILYK